jgi:DNA-binding transcriptional LysR family regulator
MTLALGIARERLPHVRITWRISDNPVFGSGETPDLILHFGPLPSAGSWISTTLYRAPERLVASADYGAEKGLPTSLEELSNHTLLVWKPPSEEAELLPLRGGGHYRVAPVFVSPDVHLVRSLAIAGLGIAFVPDGGVPEVGESGSLLPVLADEVGRDQALKALVPATLSTLPTGQRLLDLLRELSALLGA